MCPLHGPAAGQPHCPRPGTCAAVTAAVAVATAPSTAAAPDDDRAAILGALRQRRKGTRARGPVARARRRRRSGIAPAPRAGRKGAAAPRGGGSWRGRYADSVGARTAEAGRVPGAWAPLGTPPRSAAPLDRK